MNTIMKNFLAVFIGLLLGGVVNMGLIIGGSSIIPPPAGVDVTSSESIAAAMELFTARHFIFPFLAHALGTLVGAVVAYLVAASQKLKLAYLIGALFLLGGISNVFLIPAPLWFIVLDLVAAYIPMAWLGIFIAMKLKPAKALEETG